MYVVVSAINAYCAEVMVVDVDVMPVLVARTAVPAASNNFTMYESLLGSALQDTSIDFNVDEVAVATTDVGAPRAVGVGVVTNTAAGPVDSSPSPNWPSTSLPQHLMVVSSNRAQACEA